MARVLISFEELGAALGRIPAIEFDGEKHLDGNQLLHAITVLVRGDGVSTRADLSAVPENPAERALVDANPVRTERIGDGLDRPQMPNPYVDPEMSDDLRRQRASEQEQFETYEECKARLAALPLGECVGCKHGAHGVECYGNRGEEVACPCADYVDSVERDPIEVAREHMLGGGRAPAWWAELHPAAAGIQSMISYASENERHMMFDRPVRDL